MKKATAISSLFIFGGIGTLTYLFAKGLNLNLQFDLYGDDTHHYC